MKGCCPPPGAEIFDDRLARRDAQRYRRKGLGTVSRRLVALATGRGDDILEIGGGVGAVQLELLRAGARRSVNVELSPSYEAEATALAAEAQLADRIERRVLDFAREAHTIEPAEVVILNRVVCCYPDMPALVGAAADHARAWLGLVYPRESVPTLLAKLGLNAWSRLTRKEFRFFVHPAAEIARVAVEHGLRPSTRERRAFWEIAVFERAQTRRTSGTEPSIPTR